MLNSFLLSLAIHMDHFVVPQKASLSGFCWRPLVPFALSACEQAFNGWVLPSLVHLVSHGVAAAIAVAVAVAIAALAGALAPIAVEIAATVAATIAVAGAVCCWCGCCCRCYYCCLLLLRLLLLLLYVSVTVACWCLLVLALLVDCGGGGGGSSGGSGGGGGHGGRDALIIPIIPNINIAFTWKFVHSHESLGIVQIASLPKEGPVGFCGSASSCQFVHRTSKCFVGTMGLPYPTPNCPACISTT